MTSKLARERLAKIKSWRETYGAGSNVMLPAEEAEELARIALAVMDGEPVAYMTYKGYLLHAGDPKLAEYSEPTPLYADPRTAAMPAAPVAWLWSRDDERDVSLTPPDDDDDAADAIECGWTATPLYRHAQQPVVPRVTCWSCRNQVEISAIGDCDGYCPECDAPIDLGEEPYTSEQAVPVVRESDDGFNLHKYGIGYADDETQGRWDTWLACRAAMLNHPSSIQPNTDATPGAEIKHPSSNSPAIPEGYVMVPKEPTKEMIDAGWLHYMATKNPSSKGTYKAMLAAAPQEVKGE